MIVQKMKAVLFLSLLVFLTSQGIEVFAEPASPSYQIGPSDQLRIFIWKELELTQDLQVMPDGRITFPLIGEIEAAGKTVTDLKKVISERLKKYVTAPEVTVIVKESNSRTIYLIGRVARPGPYSLGSEMTVLQALSLAGGFAEWADEKAIKIVRRENGKEIQLPFNYKDYIGGRNIEQNVLLRPSDTVVVP
ncbi:MAG: polysaccharide export protein [Desulfobacteraceae bacterium]|nr:MAG: polysaccharide export protein [Desulfobacteraceae bacterium]